MDWQPINSAPEHTWMTIDGYFVGEPNDAVGRVAYTRTDLTIRRDDPVLKQVMEALTRIGGYCREESCISQGEINCGRWARTALAALKERIGGDNG